ncbi:MAG: hypothetical protein JW395_2179 [Nitrospira sp.]|nr:hypothetical protein [Nitrospira sp.]
MDYINELRHRVIRDGALTAVLAFVAAGATVSTFFGLRALVPATGPEGLLISLVCAAVVGVGLFGLWHRIIKLVPMLHEPRRKGLGISLGVVLFLVAASINSWFIATSIGGTRAVQAYMNNYLAGANTQLGHSVQNFGAEQALIPTIQNYAAGWRVQAKNEAAQGTISGRQGLGPVVQALNGAADSMESLVATMQRTQKDFADHRELADQTLADLAKLANSSEGATSATQAKFSETAGHFFQKLREMERLSLLPQVKLRGIVIVKTQIGGSVADNLKNIEVSLDKQTEELQRAVKKIEGSRLSTEVLPYAPTNQGTATWEHAGAVPGAGLVGLGIDLLPLLVLLLLMLTHGEARDPHVSRPPFSVVDGGNSVRGAA